jgi:hypothetical protein
VFSSFLSSIIYEICRSSKRARTNCERYLKTVLSESDCFPRRMRAERSGGRRGCGGDRGREFGRGRGRIAAPARVTSWCVVSYHFHITKLRRVQLSNCETTPIKFVSMSVVQHRLLQTTNRTNGATQGDVITPDRSASLYRVPALNPPLFVPRRRCLFLTNFLSRSNLDPAPFAWMTRTVKHY